LKTYKTNYNLKKDVNFSNNNSQSLRSAKTKNNLKKTVTSYPSSTNKKFNANEFKKQLDSFNDWEVKRKAKLKQMQQEKIEKEKNLLKNPTINNEANLKFNTNPKNYDAVERLYTQDLIKRKEKKIALTKIYTPTFKPKLYTTKQNLGKVVHFNNRENRKIKVYNKKRIDESEEEDEEEEESEEEKNYKKVKIKTHKIYNKKDDDDESEEEEGYNSKKKKKQTRTNLSVQKKKIKMKISDDEDDEEENVEKNKPIKIDGKKVELKLRDLLFKKMKPIRKNNSVGKRNNA